MQLLHLQPQGWLLLWAGSELGSGNAAAGGGAEVGSPHPKIRSILEVLGPYSGLQQCQERCQEWVFPSLQLCQDS